MSDVRENYLWKISMFDKPQNIGNEVMGGKKV
jgi:hypothetical protein